MHRILHEYYHQCDDRAYGNIQAEQLSLKFFINVCATECNEGMASSVCPNVSCHREVVAYFRPLSKQLSAASLSLLRSVEGHSNWRRNACQHVPPRSTTTIFRNFRNASSSCCLRPDEIRFACDVSMAAPWKNFTNRDDWSDVAARCLCFCAVQTQPSVSGLVWCSNNYKLH